MKSKLCSAVLAFSAFILILTFSIGLPIYVRPFYYAHIDPLDLELMSGYEKDEIVDAYNEVLDYLTLPGAEFGTGVMEYSEEGYAHFEDCKGLFALNGMALFCSAGIVLVLFILRKKRVIGKLSINGISPIFYSGVAAIVIPSLLGFIIALDFDRAFEVFHRIFFPGKDNWLFDPARDEIINVLPEEFFRNCAILIGASVLILGTLSIVLSLLKRKKETA